MAFCRDFVPLRFTASSSLAGVIRSMNNMRFGGTDCSVPMTWALKNNVPVDSFFVYTDSETWAGSVHPFQALRRYRDKTGIDSRLVVVGMTATEFTIADPSDAGMMDVVGFDTAAPAIMNAFCRGNL